MKNLYVYPNNTIEVHQTAVNRKNTGDSKTRLNSIENNVRADYVVYDQHFLENSIEHISNNNFYSPFKADLESLYNYQSATIRELRGIIELKQIRTIRTTCQNCTINSANTLDHILPQSNFPEFIVNPKNLFPCCSECNSYKNQYIEKDGIKLFLNLYLDILPDIQYLFVDFVFDENNEIDFRFFLENRYGIEQNSFNLIESHFLKLHLTERMRKKANAEYTEIENSILNKLDSLTLVEIFDEFNKNIIDDQRAYGFNHWKCILKLSISKDERYKIYIEEKHKERTKA